MRFKEFLKESLEIGNKVKFDNKDWEVLELSPTKAKLVSKDGNEIVEVLRQEVEIVNEVIDPDYKPGGKYYRAPAEYKKDLDTGAEVYQVREGSLTKYYIRGTKEQQIAHADKLYAEYPPEGYGSQVSKTSDANIILFSRRGSAD